MDLDLLSDIHGFLPEKYFLCRILCKRIYSRQTKISFVDYERKNYMAFIEKENRPRLKKVVWKNLSGIQCQEYGPAVSVGYNYYYINQKRIQRTAGPAMIIRDPSACTWTPMLSGILLRFEGYDPLILSCRVTIMIESVKE